MSPLKVTQGSPNGKAYWRSLDELADNLEFRRFVENEFPAYADEMLAPASRRSFLKIMGASLALAGMTACRWPREEILPFTQRPEGFTPGEPQRFATAMELAGTATGLLVTSFDGRPVKIEGNPSHPASLGATSAMAQAAVLELYDPDRSRGVVRREAGKEFASSWDEFEAFARPHFAALRVAGGAGMRVLAEAGSSPTLASMRRRFQQAFPQAVWYEYEPVSRDAEREGTRLVFGRPLRPQPAFDQAATIVSLDEDFLLQHPAAVRFARDFVEGRSTERKAINRLYVAESGYSVTGTMADHRLPMPSRMIPVFAGCLAANLVFEHGLELPAASGPLRRVLERFQSHPLYNETDWAPAAELAAHRGKSLILAGPRQPAAVHALVHLLNHALGNVGRTLTYVEDPFPSRPTHVASVQRLAAEIDAGAVSTLLVVGGNPAYDGPADLDLARRIAGVPQTIRLGLHDDETSQAARWHLPRAHFLESWGDARDWRGTDSIVQPLIEPLFGGRSPIELLALVLDEAPTGGYDLVRRRFLAAHPGGEKAWRQALHDGLVADSQPAAAPIGAPAAGWAEQLAPFLRTRAAGEAGNLEVVFAPDARVFDGRFANNGWLQEVPEPLTKLTWDNAAMVGPSTARALGVSQGEMLRIERDGSSLELPVYVMPGQAANSMTVHLGYGRRRAGRVGDGLGFDAYSVRASDGMHSAEFAVAAAGGSYPLSTTQNHYAIDPLGRGEADERSREMAREMEHEAYVHLKEDPSHHAEHSFHEAPLWKQWEYEGHKWGMAIDLNACTGCSACVVACQAENNIPVVGKDEVARGREMHWIRVDRYFQGDPEAPSVAHQPLTCHHCENAPCEQVCPVAATVHDAEGLNVMVYNRCVGTRYCMNNCPYKVRRFNYFNNHKNETSLQEMVYNPQVTVRSRGVMEKCSFCVQRISRTKIKARNERRPIADGEIVPACAQACPTRAIAFGDLNDKHGRVARMQEDIRAYALLDWLYVKPRTRYLTRLRNRRPDGGAHGEHS